MVDTEDASRGPLSGCIRLADSSRIIQRLKVGGSCLVIVRDFVVRVFTITHLIIQCCDEKYEYGHCSSLIFWLFMVTVYICVIEIYIIYTVI